MVLVLVVDFVLLLFDAVVEVLPAGLVLVFEVEEVDFLAVDVCALAVRAKAPTNNSEAKVLITFMFYF